MGSGLGLNITKTLADLLKHEIKFVSKYSYGSEFTLIIKYGHNTHETLTSVLITTNNLTDDNKYNSINFHDRFFVNKENKIHSLQIDKSLSYEQKTEKSLLHSYCINNENSFNSEDISVIHKNLPILISEKVNCFGVNGYLSVFNDKLKIMVVDDNKYIRQSVKNVISTIMKNNKKDFEIVEGNDGVDIIEKLVKDQQRNSLIRCIVTDENMEYLNGSEAIKLLRDLERNNKFKNTPIISLTAFEDHA